MSRDLRPETLRSRLVVLGVLGLIGLAGCVIVYRALLLRERAMREAQFRLDAQQRVSMIQRNFGVNLDVVRALAAFFQASQSVEPYEFATFTRPLLDRHAGIQELAWAPLVLGEEREFYEENLSEALPDFEIVDRDAEGRVVPAGDRPEYFPVQYIEANQQTWLRAGWDLASSPEFADVLRSARRTGEMQATARMRLGQGEDAPWGFMLTAPVYRRGRDVVTPRQREEEIEGFVLGVYLVGKVVETSLSLIDPVGIDVYVFHGGAEEDDALLYYRPSRLWPRARQSGPLDRRAVVRGLHESAMIDFPGRQWWIYCRPTDRYVGWKPTLLPPVALIASLMITGLLLAYANALMGRTAQVRRLVERRTAELREAKESLERGEAELRQSEALYESLVENLPVMVLRKDLEGRFTFVNRSFCKLLGRPLAEVLGKTDSDFYPPDLAEKFRADDRRVVETGALLETIEENTQDGRRRFVQVMKFPVHDAAGEIAGVQAIFWDVTQRKQAEAALEKERSLLHALMDTLPHNIYFKDRDSRFIRVNKAMARYFGLADASAAIAKSDFDFFAEEHARQALADEEAIIATGKPLLDQEEKETWPDGRVTWVSTTKLPLLDEAGRIVGTFGISRDVTDQKLAAEALKAAKEAAESASRAKSEFLANMSHEIRTPLNAILGLTELVLETDLGPTQREYVRMVHDSGDNLLMVINDILDFSKIEAGKLELEPVPFELREHLGDTMKSMALRAHLQGLELAYRVDADVPEHLVGDPVRLRQVVVNLVGNAVKFTEQGEVVLHVDRESVHDGEAVLHFCVCDTGIGVPEDKLDAIFEMFEQADKSTTRKYGGTGLGLAICSRLVDCMGGRIWVESELGEGSRFHFTARFGLADGRRPALPAAVETLRGLRVLVVDDNATNRRILAEMITNWEMEAHCVPSSAEALEELAKASSAGEPYRLVLTDSNMPQLDGFALAQRIKEDPGLGSTVIMMLTSGDHPGDVARCEEMGIASYLIKPVKQSELFDAIALVMGVASVEPEGATAPEAGAEGLEPLRVLLAEDSPVNQKLAQGLLERRGHRVTVARTGREAIDAVTSQAFDLVLMDVQMPEIDGWEATRQIRAWEKEAGGHVPIVAMTAHAMKGDRQRCLAAGMDEYVAKPIRASRLLETIASVLGKRRPAADEPEPPPSAPTDAVVDWPAALAAVRQDRGLLAGVIETFLEEAPRLLEEIRAAVARGDAEALKIAAHTFKGSIRLFGAARVYDTAMALERMGSSGELGGAEGVVEELQRHAEDLVPELERFRENDVPPHA